MFQRMRVLSRGSGPVIVGIGAAGLVGWCFGIDILKTVIPGLSPMKPNSAVALIFCGISLWLLQLEDGAKTSWRRRLGIAAASFALLIGFLTLIQYLFQVNLHIDELLFRETRPGVRFPGRMSPQAALSLFFSSLALLSLRLRSAVAHRASHWLASASALVSFSALLGYFYSISVFYKFQSYTGMALHTAAGFTLLNTGIVCARPDAGFWGAWFKDTPGSLLLRRALPGAALASFVLGWLWLEGQRLGLFGAEIGVALLITSASLVFLLAVASAAKSVDKAAAMVSEHFRLALESFSTGMLLADQSGRIRMVNAQVERQFGYGRAEIVGKPMDWLVPGLSHVAGEGVDGEAENAGNGGADLCGLRKDGREIPIQIRIDPLQTPLGKFLFGSIVDLTERKRAEQERVLFVQKLQTFNAELEERVRHRTAELSSTLKEREILLQEIHHRVKNNLQVISSLINLKLRGVIDGSSREALEECRARVSAIALIHEMLYRSSDYANVSLTEYVQRLARNVFQMSTGDSGRITMNLAAIEQLGLPVDKAVPCGLILSELINNALKHAFPNDRRGTIQIGLKNLESGRLMLSVSDDGVGMPLDLDLRQSKSLGMNLIRTLAGQLGGEFAMASRPQQGSCFTLIFGAV